MRHPSFDTDWLAASAGATPQATALIDDDGTAVSYGELDLLADEAAGKMERDVGVLPGDITVVAIRSVGLPLLAMLWGVWRAGVVPLLIDQESPLVAGWSNVVRERWDMDMPAVAAPAAAPTCSPR